jgi:hypothetical protein
MRTLVPALTVSLVVAAALPMAAQETVTMNDVSLPTRVEVEGHSLMLNGMALRKKSIFKVYVAGLYLPEKRTSADQILSADSPRRMVLQFLRGVDAQRMCDAWNDGLKDNTPNASAELKQKFVALCGYMENVAKGEQFVFTYLPGIGTRVEVKGKVKGTIEGKEFADALFKAWIGPKPGPGEDFKRKLLGAANT